MNHRDDVLIIFLLNHPHFRVVFVDLHFVSTSAFKHIAYDDN
jgi:hypothetical protein